MSFFTPKWLKENTVRYIEIEEKAALIVSSDGARWADLERPASVLKSFCDKNDIPWLEVSQEWDYSLSEYKLSGSSQQAMIMWFEDLCITYPPQGYATDWRTSPRIKGGKWHARATRYMCCD